MLEDSEAHERAMTAYYSAIIYAAFVVLCLARVLWLRQKPPIPDDEYYDEE